MIIPLTKEEKILSLQDTQEASLFRKHLAQRSFYHFMLFYLQDSFELAPAPFHIDIIDALESNDKYISMLGFRGSAKSTYLEAYALWAMLSGQYQFIVFVGSTESDSKMRLANIRDEVEENKLLQKDFDILLSEKKTGFTEKWTESQLILNGCTIIAKSKGQKIRGAKFKKARIDIIIGDDLEDVEDTKTAEKRAKTRQWFLTEMLPATKQGRLADKIKVVLLGNLVHRDCLLMNLKKNKIVKTLEFPLLDPDTGEIAWKGLYPNMEAIEKEKEKVYIAGEGYGPIIWAREYLLKLVDEMDAPLKREDVKFYPKEWLLRPTQRAGVGQDFAISQKQTADYTAMVKGKEVADDEGLMRLLILPGSIRERLSFEDTIKRSKEVYNLMPNGTVFYPEDVAYQKAAVEILKKNGIPVRPQSNTKDKRARLVSACYYVTTGRVLFPEEGADDLLDNIIGFGIEAHDDLADAFANLVLGMVAKSNSSVFVA